MAQKPLGELVNLFGAKLALSETFGNSKRKRLLFPERVFWLFLAQVLSPDGSCREAVCKFLAWLAVVENKEASPCTGGYCEARARLPLDALREVHGKVAQSVEENYWRWLGRSVKVVDGSSVSMPDTPKNQKQYPQPSAQKPGCGFPVMRVVALFSLGSGMLLELAKGALSVHERTLFRQLWDSLSPDDVVLADSGFCGYADFHLLRQRGVDSVMRNHGSRTRGRKEIKRLGREDFLVQWLKPKRCPQWLSKEEWREIPDFIEVREVRIAVEVPGFRTKHLVVATTLLDDAVYPKEAIAQLYRKRWAVELYLRDIKITMGMDILRCKSPEMVEKELWMYVIAHNLIRTLMNQAAQAHKQPIERISFKGTLDTIRQWAPILTTIRSEREYKQNLNRMLRYIATDLLPSRPDRVEPRALKRRKKNYQNLTKPRSIFKETPHRGKKRAA